MHPRSRYILPTITLMVSLLFSGYSAFAQSSPTLPTLTYKATPFTDTVQFTATTTFSSNPAFANGGPYGLGFTTNNTDYHVLSGQSPDNITFTYASGEGATLSYTDGQAISGSVAATLIPAETDVELIDFSLTGYENVPNISQFVIAAFNESQYEDQYGGEILAAIYPLGWEFGSEPTDFHFSTPTDPIEPDDPLDFYVIATIPNGFHAYQSDNYNAYNKPFDGDNAPSDAFITPLTPQAAVPEPESIVPFVLGGLGLIGLAIRKRRSRS